VSSEDAARVAAEAAGTFALVFFGCGAIMVDAEGGRLGQVGVSAAFGLVVMAMVYAFGHVSGAHINPAVTLALAATRRFPWRLLPGYWTAQVAGAVTAALLLRASLGDVADLGATTPSGSDAQSFVWEVVMTAALLVVIAALATDARAPAVVAGVAIGGTIAAASLVGGPISGASLNPARSLGPALVSGSLGSLWIYLLAPLAGGILGVMLYERVSRVSPP
jgi:MIP family channel proteins